MRPLLEGKTTLLREDKMRSEQTSDLQVNYILTANIIYDILKSSPFCCQAQKVSFDAKLKRYPLMPSSKGIL
jgi:hypothetical protein